jgi:hypothetical protein
MVPELDSDGNGTCTADHSRPILDEVTLAYTASTSRREGKRRRPQRGQWACRATSRSCPHQQTESGRAMKACVHPFVPGARGIVLIVITAFVR